MTDDVRSAIASSRWLFANRIPGSAAAERPRAITLRTGQRVTSGVTLRDVANAVRFHIIEVWWPGTKVVGLSPEAERLVHTQTHNLVRALDDAAIALSMFDYEYAQALQRPLQRPRESLKTEFERENQRRREIENEVRNRLRIPRDDFSRLREITQTAEVELKRERWLSGVLPRSYAQRLVFVHARSYLFALDRLERCFAGIVEHAEAPSAAKDEYAIFVAAFPQLSDVRDSVAHYDERSVGKGRGGGKLKLKPVSKRMIEAPGGALIIELLNDRHFGCTLADGHYGEVEISIDRLSTAAGCVQRLLDAFDWQGPSRHVPD